MVAMYIKSLSFILKIVFLIIFCNKVYASDHGYTVGPMAIFVNAESDAEAKEKGFSLAKYKAWKILKDRLFIDGISKLSNDFFMYRDELGNIVSAKEKEFTFKVTNDFEKNLKNLVITLKDLDKLIEGIVVEKSNSYEGTYQGGLTITFSKKAVENYLNDNSIKYLKINEDPILIIPVFTYDGNHIIGDEKIEKEINPVYNSLTYLNYKKSFLPLNIYSIINGKAFVYDDLNTNSLLDYARINGYKDVIVYELKKNNENSYTYSLNGFGSVFKKFHYNKKINLNNLNDLNNISSDFLFSLQNSWHEYNTKLNGKTFLQILMIESKNPLYWKDIKKKLLKLSTISNIYIKSIRGNIIYASANVNGNTNDLLRDLSVSGFSNVETKSGAIYIVDKY